MSTLHTKIDSDETELFRGTCKAYRFAATEWKERGDGELVIAKSEKFSRVLLHREGTGKLAVNFPIYDLEIKEMGTNPKAVTVACLDYSDDQSKGVVTVFAFKFKEEAECKKFEEVCQGKEAQMPSQDKPEKKDEEKGDEAVEVAEKEPEKVEETKEE